MTDHAISIARVGKRFYDINKGKRLVTEVNFRMKNVTEEEHDKYFDELDIKIVSPFDEFSDDDVEKYRDLFMVEDTYDGGRYPLCISTILKQVDFNTMPKIYVNVDGKIISIRSIVNGNAQCKFNGSDDVYMTSRIKDYTILSFIRMLKETHLDFEYYLESYSLTSKYEGITADKLLFIFLFNLLCRDIVIITDDDIEGVKEAIIDSLIYD